MDTQINLAIAEDNEIVRKGVMDLIRDMGGYSIDIEAANGKELFDKLCSAKHKPDIAIIDIRMPIWNGYETLDAIKKTLPLMKVLILTMHNHEQAIIQMFRKGANGYLLKNSSPNDLQKAIQSIYYTGKYYSENVADSMINRLQRSATVPTLNDREIQLLKLCHTDLTYKEIADTMNMSETSVSGYRVSLFDKLGVKSRAGLVNCEIEMGLKPFDYK